MAVASWTGMWDLADFSLTTVLVLALLLTLLFLAKGGKWRRRAPGPFGLPVLGYLPFLDPKAPYVTLTNLARRFGRIYALDLGAVHTVVLSDVKLIRQALAQDAFNGRAPLYVTHGIMKGRGLICAEGETWRIHRRFAEKTLRDLGVTKIGNGKLNIEKRIQKTLDGFMTDMKNHGEFESVDIVPSLRHWLGCLIYDLVFGFTYEREDPTWIYLQHLLDEGFKAVSVAGTLNFLPWLRWASKFSKMMEFLIDGKMKTHKTYQALIDASAASLDPNNVNCIVEAYLLEMNKRKDEDFTTMDQLYHVLADMIGAGWDTNLTSLKWLFLYMALFPHVQEKVAKEIEDRVGHNSITIEDLDHLPYMRAVVQEMWRLKTITPLGIPHGTSEDTTIGDFFVPKGTMVLPLLWAVHHDEEYWKDAEEFRPDRHLNDDGSVRRSENLIPFQTGKRKCLGEELGRWTVELYFANFINTFVVGLGSEYEVDQVPECGITLVPKEFNLVLKPRPRCIE